jgi:hypothetical protein
MGMLGSNTRTFGLLLLLTTASGCCGPDFEEAVAQHRAGVEKKIAPLASIHKQVLALPALQKDEVTPPSSPLVVRLDGYGDNAGNVSLCHAEDLAAAEELGFVPCRMRNSAWLNTCASYLRRGHAVFDPATPNEMLTQPLGFTANDAFKRCEAMTTLLVLRTLEFVEPSPPVAAPASFQPDLTICGAAASGSAAPASTAPSEDRKTFSGGRIRADALFFSLEDARYLGGFRVEASSSPRLKGTDVHGDLDSQLRKAIYDGVRKHIPGATIHE